MIGGAMLPSGPYFIPTRSAWKPESGSLPNDCTRPRIFHSWCDCEPAYVGCAPLGTWSITANVRLSPGDNTKAGPTGNDCSNVFFASRTGVVNLFWHRGHVAFSLAVTCSCATRSTKTPWDFTSPPEDITVIWTFMPSSGKTACSGYAMLTLAAPPVIACAAFFSLSKTPTEIAESMTCRKTGNSLRGEYHSAFSRDAQPTESPCKLGGRTTSRSLIIAPPGLSTS